MTIDEAITHAEEVAEEEEKQAIWLQSEGNPNYQNCVEHAKKQRQLAKWLEELKKYRAIFEKMGKILADNGYTIDDLDTIFGKVNEEVNADDD